MPSKPSMPETGVLLGAIVLEQQSSLEEFNRRTGVRHAAFMSFADFPQMLDPAHPHHDRTARFLSACKAAGALPALTLECFEGLASYRREDIKALARLLNAHDVPLILRWNHEMNGSWYPWGHQPDLYIEKFRAFAEALRRDAPQVAMAWTPNQGWGYPWPGGKHSNPAVEGGDPYLPYYPGDDAVDWVGLSFYHWGEDRGANQVPPPSKWAQAHGLGGGVPNLHDLFAAARKKPMMIAETSAFYDRNDTRGGGAREADIKKAWLRQVYDLGYDGPGRPDRDFPWLKAVFWFDVLKHEDEVGSEVDWRISGNQDVARFYSQLTAPEYFVK